MLEDGGVEVGVESALLPKSVTSCQLFVLGFSIFLKGGLLGAYLPFSSLWLSLKGYSNHDLGIVSVVDAIFSLLLPVVGGTLDKLRSHNLGFVVLLIILAVLKLSYIPAATSFIVILILTAFTAPLLRASNSILDCLALYAFTNKGYFTRSGFWFYCSWRRGGIPMDQERGCHIFDLCMYMRCALLVLDDNLQICVQHTP